MLMPTSAPLTDSVMTTSIQRTDGRMKFWTAADALECPRWLNIMRRSGRRILILAQVCMKIVQERTSLILAATPDLSTAIPCKNLFEDWKHQKRRDLCASPTQPHAAGRSIRGLWVTTGSKLCVRAKDVRRENIALETPGSKVSCNLCRRDTQSFPLRAGLATSTARVGKNPIIMMCKYT